MLGLWTAGIGLLAVPVAETGVDPQGDIASRGAGSQLVNHIWRTDVNRNILFQHQLECFAIEDIGGIDDARRMRSGVKAGSQGTSDFPGAHRVYHHPQLAQAIKDGNIRERFLGIADRVKSLQLGYFLLD